MSTNQIEKEKELPQEKWNNEPKPQPFTSETKPYLLQFVDDVKSLGGGFEDELTVKPGESIELTFDMSDPATGPKTKRFPKKDKVTGQIIMNPATGEKIYDEQIRPNFVVYNHKTKKKQNWWIAKKWAHMAAETMMEYNTDTLIAKRIGEGLETIYNFMPTGLKSAL